MAAVIEASDTIRDKPRAARKAAAAIATASGARPIQRPRPVATPRPPVKLRKIDAIEPRNAAKATIASAPGARPATRPIITGRRPLRKSPAKVRAAGVLPPARATLVMPTLPEPTDRGSNPNARPTRTPTGIEPIR